MKFIHLPDPDDALYDFRTMAERNARLKDEFGARFVRVRGAIKVKCHLMFGVPASPSISYSAPAPSCLPQPYPLIPATQRRAEKASLTDRNYESFCGPGNHVGYPCSPDRPAQARLPPPACSPVRRRRSGPL